MTETPEREPEFRDPGDRERLRDKAPEWFKHLGDRTDTDPENGDDDG